MGGMPKAGCWLLTKVHMQTCQLSSCTLAASCGQAHLWLAASWDNVLLFRAPGGSPAPSSWLACTAALGQHYTTLQVSSACVASDATLSQQLQKSAMHRPLQA